MWTLEHRAAARREGLRIQPTCTAYDKRARPRTAGDRKRMGTAMSGALGGIRKTNAGG